MPDLVTRRGALPAARVTELREALLASPLVARSPLAGSFRASRGFAITFTPEGRDALERRFPFVRPFLALALGPEEARALWPLRRRWLGDPAARIPNACYLNLLLLGEGGGV